MNTRSPHSSRLSLLVRPPASGQRGVVLLVSLLFLIVLTLLGVAASRMVTSEERQSRYLREYNTAFQASESAMRDARDDIDGILATNVKKVVPRIEGLKGFTADCSYGLCSYDRSETTWPWKDETKWGKAVTYGTYSLRSPLPKSAVVGTKPGDAKNEDEATVDRYNKITDAATSSVTGVWQQPAYLIEGIRDDRPGTSSVQFGGKSPPTIYRITARGYGADPNSRAAVQEIYVSAIAAGGF